MSDIIQDAKKLQSELQSERADWVRMRGGMDIEMPLDCTVLYGDEEACEVIGALAEETWEHRHEYRAADDQQWYALTPWAEGEPDRRPWNVTPTRIVRRRVSPPEVINNQEEES